MNLLEPVLTTIAPDFYGVYDQLGNRYLCMGAAEYRRLLANLYREWIVNAHRPFGANPPVAPVPCSAPDAPVSMSNTRTSPSPTSAESSACSGVSAQNGITVTQDAEQAPA